MLICQRRKRSSYPVSITPTDHPIRYLFEIAGVIREAEDYQLEITANGSPAGIDRKLTENVLIPAKNDFRLLSAKRIDEPENGIEIVFSDPVSTTQDLNGLIEIPEVASSIFQVENNKVYVYFEANQLSKLTLKIHEGVKNSRDKSARNITLHRIQRTESETTSEHVYLSRYPARLQKFDHPFPVSQSLCGRFKCNPYF